MKRSKAIAFLLFEFMVLGSISWATERRGAQVVVSLKSGGENQAGAGQADDRDRHGP